MVPSLVPPDVPLQGPGGETMSFARPGGKLTLATIGYVSCPDLCPTTLSDWHRIRVHLGADSSRVRFVFVSGDWRADTPAGSADFARRFDPSFIGVLSDSSSLPALLAAFQADAGYDRLPGGRGYRFGHTALSYLLDEAGRIVLWYPFSSDPGFVARDIRRLLRERGLRRG